MPAHEHEWRPVAGACARYSCTCGGSGYRHNNGRILETSVAADIDPEDLITARPTANYRTGRAQRRISEEWEGWYRDQEQMI